MTLDTGHPIISIDGNHDDADIILREWLQKKLNLPIEMVADPNGSEHTFRPSSKDGKIEFGFYWGPQCEGSLFVRLRGKKQGSGTNSFFELDTTKEILILTEAEFQAGN